MTHARLGIGGERLHYWAASAVANQAWTDITDAGSEHGCHPLREVGAAPHPAQRSFGVAIGCGLVTFVDHRGQRRRK